MDVRAPSDGSSRPLDRAALRALERWRQELIDAVDARGTLMFGVLAKAAMLVDEATTATIDRLLAVDPTRVGEVVKSVAGPKRLEKLTLGERFNILEALDARYLVRPGKHVIGRDLRKTIRRVTKRRNEGAHFHGNLGTEPQALVTFIDDAITLMTSELLSYSSLQ